MEKNELGDASLALTTSKAPVDDTSGVEVGVAEAGRGGAAAGTGSQEEKEEEKRCVADVPLQSRAPDGGWGWMVALGTFILHLLVFSVPFCFGILFSGFLLEMAPRPPPPPGSTTCTW